MCHDVHMSGARTGDGDDPESTPPLGTPIPTRPRDEADADDTTDIWDVGTAPPVTTPSGDPLDPDNWPALGTPRTRGRRVSDPALPHAPAKAPPSMRDPFQRATPTASSAWYRTDEDRNRSVYRLANPWYRRLLRGVLATVLLAAAGVGVYAGVRAVQQYVERDGLPSADADVPAVRATAFLIDSAEPAPVLAGTLTLDATTGAFEYVGRADGPQAGVHVVSADGANVYVLDGGGWRASTSADAAASDALAAAQLLADDVDADAILTEAVRRGYVQLIDRVDEGEGADRLTRFELRLDTASMATDLPTEWQQFRATAIPGAAESGALPVTIWTDRAGVLVRVSEPTWAWQRLTYSEQPFRVVPPDATAGQCDTDGIVWETPLGSCAEAAEIGRDLAAAAGLPADDPAATDRIVADLCAAMAIGAGPLPATDETASLAGALVARGVCLGDPAVFQPSG